MPTPQSSPVLEAESRAWTYWFVDGLPYLTAGFLCVLLSGTFIAAEDYRATHFRVALALIIAVYGPLGVIFNPAAPNTRMAEIPHHVPTHRLRPSSLFH